MERRLLAHLSFYLFYLVSTVHGNAAELTKSPSDALLKGSTVVLQCHIPSNQRQRSIIWMRKVGLATELIIKDSVKQGIFSGLMRYKVTQIVNADGDVHILTIDDLEYEDTAEIGCAVDAGIDTEASYQSLAVCDDVESEWCICIVEKMWNDPACFQKSESVKKMEASYKRSVLGLGICLAVTIVYGIIMTILAGIDCSKRLHAKHKKAMERKRAMAERGHRDPYGDSETLQFDPNDTESQISYEGLRAAHSNDGPRSPIQMPPIIPQLERTTTPPYTKLEAQNTHTNQAFQGDDAEPKYQEIGNSALYANGNVPRMEKAGAYSGFSPQRSNQYDPSPAPQGHLPPTRPGFDYQMSGAKPKSQGYVSQNKPMSPDYSDSVKPRIPSAPTNYKEYGYSDQDDYQDVKSPGAWSTKSAQMPPHIGFNYNDNNDHSSQRNAYSERPSRDYPGGRGTGYAEPRRLDFTSGKMNGAVRYDDLSARSPRGDGAYVDMSDTVV